MVINDLVDAMVNKDHKAFAACFDERCRLFDYFPSLAGRHSTFLFGRNAVEMYYHNRFMFDGFTVLDPRITDERTINFYVKYNDTVVHALAQLENCTDGSCTLDHSLIKELVIRPA